MQRAIEADQVPQGGLRDDNEVDKGSSQVGSIVGECTLPENIVKFRYFFSFSFLFENLKLSKFPSPSSCHAFFGRRSARQRLRFA